MCGLADDPKKEYHKAVDGYARTSYVANPCAIMDFANIYSKIVIRQSLITLDSDGVSTCP